MKSQTSSTRLYQQASIALINNESSKIDMESYKIIFDLFDRDHSGSIDNTDLHEIAKSLNRDPNEGTHKSSYRNYLISLKYYDSIFLFTFNDFWYVLVIELV